MSPATVRIAEATSAPRRQRSRQAVAAGAVEVCEKRLVLLIGHASDAVCQHGPRIHEVAIMRLT